MYFQNIEKNQTKLWIINSLLTLLEKKDYSSITINMIVDHAELGRRTFYRHFKTKDDTMKYITQLLMNQFAQQLLENHSTGMEEVAKLYEQYNFEFSIKLAGFWKATIIWCEENPRKSPEEMAKIITSLLS